MRTPTVLVLSLLLAVVCGAVLRARGPLAPPAGSVCFVDMNRCLDGYAAAQAELEKLREKWREPLAQLEERGKKLKEEQSALAALDPQSEEFQTRSHDLDSQKMMLDRDQKFIAERINLQRMQLLIRTYRQIQKAAESVGKAQGYAAVLVIPTSLEELPADPKAALENLQLRTNLWTNPQYDVTADVIAALQAP